MTKLPRNTGFEGRRFLDEVEWRTYCRRMPVRYVGKPKDVECNVCGQPGTLQNPLQNAHLIGFGVGVIDLGLTPEFLDSDENIVTAHRLSCNNAAEIGLSSAMVRLRELGVHSLPGYLPQSIQEIWAEIAVGQARDEPHL